MDREHGRRLGFHPAVSFPPSVSVHLAGREKAAPRMADEAASTPERWKEPSARAAPAIAAAKQARAQLDEFITTEDQVEPTIMSLLEGNKAELQRELETVKQERKTLHETNLAIVSKSAEVESARLAAEKEKSDSALLLQEKDKEIVRARGPARHEAATAAGLVGSTT